MNLIFDLDGTICFNGKDIEPEILGELKRINQKHNLIFASARPIRDMLPVLKNDFLNNNLIGGNGSIYQVDGKIETNGFTKAEISPILSALEIKGIPFLVDGPWDYFYNGPNNELKAKLDTDNLAKNIEWRNLEEVIKLVVLAKNQEQVKTLQMSIKEMINCEMHQFANEPLFDLVPRKINKANVVKQIIDSETYIAFGNDFNDIELLKAANKAYIVGNQVTIPGITNISERQLVEILKQF